jgi:predicted SnoaL-like aldol condensation-catalyzing enzyme
MDCDPELTQSNKALVDQAIEELFVAGDITAVDRYWADPYLQHNPIAESGVEAFRNIFGGIVSPGMPIYEPVRTIGECDLVLIHGNYTGLTGPMFDMFRIQDNRLVEHWDAGPVGPGPNASGHTALDGPSEVQTPELGAENKALVLAFTRDVLIGGNTGEAGTYLSETLVEHSPGGEDGSAAFMEYRASEAIVYSEVHHVIADGNFAFTMSEGSLGGDAYGFYDLYRIANGLIAEHWDGRREVPATTASGLGIF